MGRIQEISKNVHLTGGVLHFGDGTSEDVVFCVRTETLFQPERRLGCNGAQSGLWDDAEM